VPICSTSEDVDNKLV